jgi:L-seryl-tRNA(Ser) seleniumtransferase
LDLVTFSGDKLLGGPQAGILIGRRDLIAACARHPLHRALRVDKMTLAALEATLRLYRDPATAAQRVPTLRMLAETPAQLEQKARRIARKLTKALGERVVIEIVSGASQVGGGALPLADLPGPVLAIRPAAISVTEFAARLRRLPTPIIARIEEDRLLADPRTILDDDEVLFQNGVVEALSDEAPEKK